MHQLNIYKEFSFENLDKKNITKRKKFKFEDNDTASLMSSTIR